MRVPWLLLAGMLTLFPARGPATAEDDPVHEKAPGPASTGQKYTWKAADGLVYEYYVPKTYDAAKGANLVLVLHGTGVPYRWGLWNLAPGEFRKDDVIVCPEGTTQMNDKQSANFMQNDKDLQRLHALHEEMKKTFKVTATYLFGHSQGSFFSYLYAGAYPDDVQGLVAQASGVWIGTQATAKGHHQAIVLMHGTADPVMPYSMSVEGREVYTNAKYPMTHLRSLEGWNHWPNQVQTEQELAWCEGMTSADPARVAAAFETLDAAPAGQGWDKDFAALYAVASRIETLAGAPDALKSRAAKAASAVDDLAKRHVDVIGASLGKGKGDKLDGGAWVGHAAFLLRDFEGVPARDAFAKDWADRLGKQESAAQKAMRDYYRTRQKDPAKAFAAAVDAIRDGFLTYQCADGEFLKGLAAWRADAAKLKIGKADLKAYDDVVPVFVEARKKGFDAYAELNRKL